MLRSWGVETGPGLLGVTQGILQPILGRNRSGKHPHVKVGRLGGGALPGLPWLSREPPGRQDCQDRAACRKEGPAAKASLPPAARAPSSHTP